MTISGLDHVNIFSANIEGLSHFYEAALGLKKGPTPDFGKYNVTWHFCGDKPIVHLVESAEPRKAIEPQIEHFAFRATDLEPFLANLRSMGVAYIVLIAPVSEARQVNLHDPDGNHIEVQFDASEQADLSPFEG